jgi:uncharacterized membrane protein YdbT with pleckstrin-like domain
MDPFDRYPGEEILVRARPLWRSFFVFFLGVIVCGVGPFTRENPPISIPTGVTFGLVFALIIARRYSDVYYLTNRRVLVRGGLFARDNTVIDLRNVQGVEAHQGITLRFMGVGHVMVRSSAPHEESIFIYGQPDPYGLKERIEQLVEQARSSASSEEPPPEAV